MVWKIQRSLPVFTSNARMCPGDPGSVSGTVLPMISRSSKTTPGVLALTLSFSAGMPEALAQIDAARPCRTTAIGCAGLRVERVEKAAIA